MNLNCVKIERQEESWNCIYIYIYIYVCIYILILKQKLVHDTQSAQHAQSKDIVSSYI